MGSGYVIKGDLIVLDRKINDLDVFVRDFITILSKHSGYLIVSGFVTISAGRPRGTEDVDLLAPIMQKDKFAMLFEELAKNGFWCYQSSNHGEAYEYLKNFQSIRFAKVNEMFPNIEFIPIDKSRKIKWFEFSNPQKIRVEDFEFKIPPIELEILYKEKILGSKKDIEDAAYLRNFYAGFIKEENFKRFERILRIENGRH